MNNTMNNDLYTYILRQADNSMILCQRLCEWVANAPELEEDIALTNIGLDLIGQARALYQYAATMSDQDIDENDLVFMRDERDWSNALLVELPNGNFADTIARQFLFDAWHLAFLEQLIHSKDETLSAIAAKSVKESRYHLRHSSNWVKRLGDGTQISHDRMQLAIDHIWHYIPELFESDELDQRMLESGIGVNLEQVKHQWNATVTNCLNKAALRRPDDTVLMSGGRYGIHTEHMGFLLAEMQILPRSMPDCQW